VMRSHDKPDLNAFRVYDAAVSGADPIDMRPGFAAMLERIERNGVRTIIVETASRFARDLMVQEVGHAKLRELVVVLGRDPIARLEFSLGQCQIPVIVSSRVVRAP
jgi:DNA invertase Pin-like site-specific DNA recombinase